MRRLGHDQRVIDKSKRLTQSVTSSSMPFTDEQLLAKIGEREDNFVERKSNAQRAEIRQTLSAFANSLPETREGIIFIGIADNGNVVGVDNTEGAQRTVGEAAADCYPTVAYTARVIRPEGRNVVAITVPHSRERPHFSGAAFVRVGSQSRNASAEQYNDLISSRNEIAGKILQSKNQIVTLELLGRALGDPRPTPNSRGRAQCRIMECDALSVLFMDIASNTVYSEPLSRITLASDVTANNRLKIILTT
jgi:hypothetical protein